MLPFLKNKKESGVAVVESVERKADDGSVPDVLEGAMEELQAALSRSDWKQAADIFRSAFELMDSQPHEEGTHVD
jgi:hypothetical protein